MSTTRLLILGVLMTKPMHGYEVRRELETWRAEHWANIAYGSLYFGLKKMAEEGLVEVAETEQDTGGRPARTVYAITEAGRQEFHRLLSTIWWDTSYPKDPFIAALNFMPHMETEELLAALRHRAGWLRSQLAANQYLELAKGKLVGPHVAEIVRLATAHTKAELEWIEELVVKVERGASRK